MAGTIVLGYDGTARAKAALEVAMELAAATDSKLVVGYAYGPYRGAGEVRAEADALHARGEQVSAEALAVARERGVDAEAELVDERPAPALADLATARGADYIVVGTYGEKPITGRDPRVHASQAAADRAGARDRGPGRGPAAVDRLPRGYPRRFRFASHRIWGIVESWTSPAHSASPCPPTSYSSARPSGPG